MPALRICPAGAAASAARAYTLGIWRVMEVRAHLAADAFGDVDYTVFGSVLAIGPHARPVGHLARVTRHPG